MRVEVNEDLLSDAIAGARHKLKEAKRENKKLRTVESSHRVSDARRRLAKYGDLKIKLAKKSA